jgi:hypothetical protein
MKDGFITLIFNVIGVFILQVLSKKQPRWITVAAFTISSREQRSDRVANLPGALALKYKSHG